jgi:hypothetical protein
VKHPPRTAAIYGIPTVEAGQFAALCQMTGHRVTLTPGPQVGWDVTVTGVSQERLNRL